MTGLLCALVFSASAVAPHMVGVDHPLEVRLPEAIAVRWNSFDDLELPSSDGAIAVAMPESVPAGKGRADVLRRDGKSWTWLSTTSYVTPFTVPIAESDRAILVRFQGTPLYFWREIGARSRQRVSLAKYKNIEITGVAPHADLALYLPSEKAPRTLPAGQNTFRFAPVEDALACAFQAIGSRCVEIAQESTRAAIDIAGVETVRILRVDPQAKDEFQVLARGFSAIPPKKATTSIIRAMSWVAIALREEKIGWNDVVIDRSGAEFAIERLEGSTLPEPPGFGEVLSRLERGVVIRPWVGPPKEPIFDSSATLLVFPREGSPLSLSIPLAYASPDENGHFRMPSLASGRYALKLLSSMSTSQVIEASVMAGTPLDVVFHSGPTVSGRVVRTFGSPSDRVSIEVGPVMSMEQARQSDPIDNFRFPTADENGNFSFVAGSPGKYRFRARLGSASGEREFEITKSTRAVQLGDIVLRRGSTLRGSVARCRTGEVILIRAPDPSKLLAPGFGELLRSRIEQDGRFMIEGLEPGQWGVLLICDGAETPVSPDLVSIPESGDVVMDLTPATTP